jgi:hypothetical protein
MTITDNWRRCFVALGAIRFVACCNTPAFQVSEPMASHGRGIDPNADGANVPNVVGAYRGALIGGGWGSLDRGGTVARSPRSGAVW